MSRFPAGRVADPARGRSSQDRRASRPGPRLSRWELWYGRDEAPPVVRHLRTGPVALDLVDIDIRSIRLGSVDLIDRIYVSVRDRNWDTIPPEVSERRIVRRGPGTIVTFGARHRSPDVDFRWKGAITLGPDGQVRYDMEGQAETDFRYCRIGFCVLHPESSAAGRPFRVETPNGPFEGVLPTLIAPQSVVDGHEVPLFPACSSLAVDLDGAKVVTVFEGDLFEMEDQRNWTDASFKTYCTPIALGYPHRARAGQQFHQSVTLTTNHSAPSSATAGAQSRRRRPLDVVIESGSERFWPQLGVGSPANLPRPLTDREVDRLHSLRLDHVRLDVHLAAADWEACLKRVATDAAALGCGLEVALFVRDETAASLPALARGLAVGDVRRILVLHGPTAGSASTPPGWVAAVRAGLAPDVAGVPLITGTDGDFAELNRDRPQVTSADGVSYAMNPQVHAFDELSLAQSLRTQATTVRTARTFAANMPIVVSPVTLRQRFNPAATDPLDALPSELPAASDGRQMSLFGAGWTLGSLAALAGAGVASITYYETVGSRGLMDVASGPRLARPFRVLPGMVYPMYHVFADVSDRDETSLLPVDIAEASTLVALAVRKRAATRVLVANLTAQPVQAAIGPLEGSRARVRVLDEQNAHKAARAPSSFRTISSPVPTRNGAATLVLPPFAYARLDAI